jgi:putative membrane protein
MSSSSQDTEAKSSNLLAVERTDWALSRTRLAAERTMMATLRTGLSFISFGFTIFKFLQYVKQSEGANTNLRVNAPRNMGIALISVGILVLTLGSWQHWHFLKELQAESTGKFPHSVSLIAAVILLVIGVVTLITLAVRLSG